MRLYEINAQENVSFEVEKTGPQSFVVVMSKLGEDDLGSFGYSTDGEEARNLAEVHPLHRSGGYGKLLLLKAIYTANEMGIPFFEDSQETSQAQSNVYDSLYDSLYIMQPEYEDQWFVTEDGYDYLMAHSK